MAEACGPDPLFGDYADSVESAMYGEPVLPLWLQQPLHPQHHRTNHQPQAAEAFASTSRSMASPVRATGAAASQQPSSSVSQPTVRTPRHSVTAPQSSVRRTRTSSTDSIARGPPGPGRAGSTCLKSPASASGREKDLEKGAYGRVPSVAALPDSPASKLKQVPYRIGARNIVRVVCTPSRFLRVNECIRFGKYSHLGKICCRLRVATSHFRLQPSVCFRHL